MPSLYTLLVESFDKYVFRTITLFLVIESKHNFPGIVEAKTRLSPLIFISFLLSIERSFLHPYIGNKMIVNTEKEYYFSIQCLLS